MDRHLGLTLIVVIGLLADGRIYCRVETWIDGFDVSPSHGGTRNYGAILLVAPVDTNYSLSFALFLIFPQKKF